MIRIGMSTSCVFPLSTEDAFRLAEQAGFDGIEVMVTQDPTTRDSVGLTRLAHRFRLPILSVHAPVLTRSQFVWSTDPAHKLERSAELAARLGATTVVVHPPYRWQMRYARRFVDHVAAVSARYGVEVAVENMFPLTVGPVTLRVFSPGPDPTTSDAPAAVTLDFSHAALAGRDSLEMTMAAGDRLRHVHLCDGTGSMAEGHRDEHLVPGHGTQPVAEVLQYLGHRRWQGSLIAEVATGAAATDSERLEMLVETVQFARRQMSIGRSRRQGASA
ncbi:MAG: sugar phosphate isomerase/epimerase [Salinibacterium sp.]|nr:sugar phosphate isomerase/epimerase [Salinibacterium sp.]